MKKEIITYNSDDQEMLGYFSCDSNTNEKRPAVIIAHAWRGQENYFHELAEELASQGYAAFAADVYGNRRIAKDNDEAAKLMQPLFIDRNSLRKRIVSAFETVANLPEVDSKKIVAIGFCFGGLTVIELLRSGVDVRGVVCFHGVYSNNMGGNKANLVPNAEKIRGALLILHGALDPLAPMKDLLALQEEMTNARVNWQTNIYSSAAHAFTNKDANDVPNGMYYEPIAASRSFKAMDLFFEEVLQ